jgi:hypothetical protein
MRASVFSLGKNACWGCVCFGTIQKMMRVVNGDDVVSWRSIPVSSVSFQCPKSTRHAKARISVQYSWTTHCDHPVAAGRRAGVAFAHDAHLLNATR